MLTWKSDPRGGQVVESFSTSAQLSTEFGLNIGLLGIGLREMHGYGLLHQFGLGEPLLGDRQLPFGRLGLDDLLRLR